jgi:hypothetical protein
MMLEILKQVGSGPTQTLHEAATRVEHDPAMKFD